MALQKKITMRMSVKNVKESEPKYPIDKVQDPYLNQATEDPYTQHVAADPYPQSSEPLD